MRVNWKTLGLLLLQRDYCLGWSGCQRVGVSTGWMSALRNTLFLSLDWRDSYLLLLVEGTFLQAAGLGSCFLLWGMGLVVIGATFELLFRLKARTFYNVLVMAWARGWRTYLYFSLWVTCHGLPCHILWREGLVGLVVTDGVPVASVLHSPSSTCAFVLYTN